MSVKSTDDLLSAFSAFASAFQTAGSPEELSELVEKVRELVSEMERRVAASQSELAEAVERQLSRARDQLLAAVEQTANRVGGATSDTIGGLTERLSGFEDEIDEMSSQVSAVVSASERHESLLRDRISELDVLLKTRLAGDWADQGELNALEGLVQERLEQITSAFAEFQQRIQRSLEEARKNIDWRLQARSSPPAPSDAVYGAAWDGSKKAPTQDRVYDAIEGLSATYVALTDYEDADVLAKVKNVDGSGSGLDADVLRGTTPSANGLSVLSAADYAAIRTLLGLVIGTNVQAYDADLTTWAGLTPSANAQSLVTAADYAAMRTLLGLVVGTDVEAHDADLTTIAGLAPSNDDILQRKAGAWTNRTIAQLITDLGLVSDTAYNATTWDGVTGVAPSKNAVRDQLEANALLRSKVIAYSAADLSALNTVSETTLLSLTLPGGTVAAGDRLVFVAFGDALNNTGSNVNYTWRWKLGATTVLASAAVVNATGANRRKWQFAIDVLVESTSAQRVSGIQSLSGAGAASFSTSATGLVGYGTAAESLASDKAMVLTVELGTASTSADAVCHGGFLVIVRNQ